MEGVSDIEPLKPMYHFDGIGAYPPNVPREAVAAGRRCWTLMDETAACRCEA